ATARDTVPFPAPDGPSIAISTRSSLLPPRPRRTLRRFASPCHNRSAMRRIAIALAAIAVSLLASGWLLSTSAYGRTIGLLLRAAHVDGPGVARVARWQTSPVTETEHVLPTRRGELRARTYTPAVVRTRPVVLLGGV